MGQTERPGAMGVVTDFTAYYLVKAELANQHGYHGYVCIIWENGLTGKSVA